MKTKIWIGILLVSLVGLGFTVYQRISVKQKMENKIEAVLKRGIQHNKHRITTVLNEIRKTTYQVSLFKPIEAKAFALDTMTRQQLDVFDKNGQFDSLDYRSFVLEQKNYVELWYYRGLRNVDSVTHSLKSTRLHTILSKTLLLQTELLLMDYLDEKCNVHLDAFYPETPIPLPFSSSVELDSFFKATIFFTDSRNYENYKYRIFVDGKHLERKGRFNYKFIPTKTGKHEYLVEVKDDNNKTVFEHTYHFFVENCKTNNHE